MSLAISTSISSDILGRKQSAKSRFVTLIAVVTLLAFISAGIKTNESSVFVLAKLSISLMASSLGLAILMKLLLKDISERSLLCGAIVATIICCVWYSRDYSKMIVESLPAVTVGSLVTYVLYKAKF